MGNNTLNKAGAKSQVSQTSQIREFGLRSSNHKGKNFILDTNVLLHDPGCLGRFSDNNICITTDVLSELDKFKGEQTDRGANARKVHRMLSSMFSDDTDVTKGVETDGGGTVRLVIYDEGFSEKNSDVLSQFLRVFPDQQRIDHRIMAATILLSEYNDSPCILVTKDLNMQLKAKAVGIECEDYLNDKVDLSEVANYEMKNVMVDAHELQAFASTGELGLPEHRNEGVVINQYVYLMVSEKQTMPARFRADGNFVKLQIPPVLKMPDGHPLKPLNIGQKCLIDALLNPDISLVTCYGQAGTGKTLVAIAAGLHEMFERQYNGITISRPIVAMGESLGFLPGDLDEKMRPWLQPVYDALELLLEPPASSNQGPKRKQAKKGDAPEKKSYEPLLESGMIEVEALCYIRGRSIPNRYFVLDEAQQLTPQEAKTIVTRMSSGSKLVLVGDPAQIDNPYVDSRSNGLVYTRNRLKGQEFVAHIALSKGERSELAEAGAQLM
ncbi:PhoH family protein [Akkermansiaceae bacterium]|nr:PhoH family protein [Akkermansiaceae bacterium]